jgi:hypothetical protein
LIASLTGAGDVTPPANLQALLNAYSNQLTGAGAITATLTAYAAVQANLTGTGTVSLTPYATGQLAASITGESSLSPQNLAAAVWNALAAQYNVSGTMGNKMNLAGSGGIDYATLAAAVLAAMNATPPDVNIAKIHGQTVVGTGVQADPWGPA